MHLLAASFPNSCEVSQYSAIANDIQMLILKADAALHYCKKM